MELILVLLVAYVLVCVALPHLVRSRPHFVVGVAAVALAMLCVSIGHLFWSRLFLFLADLCNVAGLLLMVMSGTGGRLTQWYQDVGSSFRNL